MSFTQDSFDRPLLSLRANGGPRYAIAKLSATGEPWFLLIEEDGTMSGTPIRAGATGSSSSPYATWVAGGELPAGARKVEITMPGGHTVCGKARSGYWLAEIPWENRDMELTIRFIAVDGTVVATDAEYLTRV